MKKIIILILAIACVLASVLLVSCGNDTDNTQTRCKHEFKAPVVLKEPTCAEARRAFCEC